MKKVSRERMSFLPRLSLTERDRRWTALYDSAQRRDLDALVVYGTDAYLGNAMANFRYLTQVAGHHGGFAVFVGDQPPVVFNAPPHEHHPFSAWLTAQNWLDEIRPNRGIAGVADVLRDAGRGRGRIGLVGYRSGIANTTLPYPMYEHFRSLLPEATIEDATDVVEELRLVKSPEEVDLLRQAGRIAGQVVEAMIRTARPGVRENDVVAEMIRTAIVEGGEPQTFFMLTSASLYEQDEQPYLLHGIAPPNGPTSRPLRRGDLVIAEFHCSVAGYLSATEFSLTVGPAPDPIRRIHAVQRDCLQSVLSHFRPGVRLREVWEAIRRPCQDAGLDYVELGFHGHGLASPEFPTVVYKPGEGMLDGRGLDGFELRERMVFGLNIDIHDPAWRPDVGLMLGDTVVVTAAGGETLCHIPLTLPEV